MKVLGFLLLFLFTVSAVSSTPARVARQADPSTTTTASPRFLTCTRTCLTTNEYNPVCGSDGQTYQSRQRLDCARRCGANVRVSFRGTCQAL